MDSRSPARGGHHSEDEVSDGRLSLNDYEDELTITDVRRSDASTYSCRAFNSVGAATKTYTLVVQGSYNQYSLQGGAVNTELLAP